MAPTASSSRKSSNLENLGLGSKGTSRKVARAISQTVFRDASARRRNRIHSGIKASKSEGAVKRQKLAHHLPTPPASPSHSFQNMKLHDGMSGSIPRTLSRPPAQSISQEKLADVDPALAKVPVQYVRDGLRLLAPQYVFFLP